MLTTHILRILCPLLFYVSFVFDNVCVYLTDLKIGMRHESMLKLLHEQALDIYNSTSSLKLVCEWVSTPLQDRIKFEMVTPFRPFKPMLCSNQSWTEIVKLLLPSLKQLSTAVRKYCNGRKATNEVTRFKIGKSWCTPYFKFTIYGCQAGWIWIRHKEGFPIYSTSHLDGGDMQRTSAS